MGTHLLSPGHLGKMPGTEEFPSEVGRVRGCLGAKGQVVGVSGAGASQSGGLLADPE